MTQGTFARGAAEQGREVDEPQASQDYQGDHGALAMTFNELLGGDDAPGETADDMIRAVREWRDAPTRGGRD